MGCPEKERDSLGGWSARGSDTYTLVAVRVISNLQRLVIRALIERPNVDPLAEEETIIQFESFLCEKGVGPEDRAKCFRQLGKVTISSPVVREPELPWKTWGQLWPATSFQTKNRWQNRSQKHQEQRSGSRVRAVQLKCWVTTPEKFGITQDVLWSRDVTCQHPDETPPGFYISWGIATWSRVSITSGTSSRDGLCQQLQNLMECVSSAPRKVQCESTRPVVPRPRPRRRRERSEPEWKLGVGRETPGECKIASLA